MFCSNCGNNAGDVKFPWTCALCKRSFYKNPIPVMVGLLTVIDPASQHEGVLLVKRSIGKFAGQWALPGGFLDSNDASWGAGISREFKEETGYILGDDIWGPFQLGTATDGNLLIFVKAGIEPLPFNGSIPPKNNETEELKVVTEPEELAFPLHTQALKDYLRMYVEKLPAGTPNRPPMGRFGAPL